MADALGRLYRLGAAAPTLAAMHDRRATEDIRGLMSRLVEQARQLDNSIRSGQRTQASAFPPEGFEQFKQLHDQLKAKVKGWPSADE